MAHSLTSVAGVAADVVPIRTALLSVSDKTGLAALATALVARGVKLLSTGGTAKALRDAGLPVTDVAEYTGSPEILDGRVKTLHPKVHGGLLAVRGAPKHEEEMAANGISAIDLVVVNLYAFEATVSKGADFDTCIENIDIGGPSMIRSAAKNNAAVTVVTSPGQYEELLGVLETSGGGSTRALRKKYAAAAFAHTAAYDSAIAGWFVGQVATDTTAAGAAPPCTTITRTYVKSISLKYGCNPHQSPAFIGRLAETPALPFTVLNGIPGYINFLDAANAWQLAVELRTATGLAAAASFKHVSPAGAAVAVPLDANVAAAYEVDAVKAASLTPVALAYLRARNADAMCSFGDFAAVSDIVDEATASLLKPEVSDGIIAPGYTPEALALLKTKKSGAFIILQADPAFKPTSMEYREVFGMCFGQKRNDAVINDESVTKTIVTARKSMPPEAVRDLIVALIAIKYTQSNSVGYAKDGQMIGVGAGQQSRVDCVKLAGRKVVTWWLRQHPKVRALPFKEGVKRQDKVNARVRYIEGDFTPVEYAEWVTQFESPPAPLTEPEKAEFLKTLTGVSLASDAFFPFRDSIDLGARYGVSYVAQPGGSVKDADVTKAADEYGMTMAYDGVRLFHH